MNDKLPNNDHTYTCSKCDQTQIKMWTDKEALEESLSLFPLYNTEDLVVVCDDCFKEIIQRRN